MEAVEKVKTKLAEKRVFLETELSKVKRAEEFFLAMDGDVCAAIFTALGKEPSNYGILTFEVRNAIKELVGRFTVKDVREQIKHTEASIYSKASITGVLIRLEVEGCIEKVERGHGSIPNIYKASRTD